jgi:hypothetical protein
VLLFLAFVTAMSAASVAFIMWTDTVDRVEQTLPSPSPGAPMK